MTVRVRIGSSDGRQVEIDTDEQGMTARRLANVAVDVWHRTTTPHADPGPARNVHLSAPVATRTGRRRFGLSSPLETS